MKADPINNPQFSKASVLYNLSLSHFPKLWQGHLLNSPIKKKEKNPVPRPHDLCSLFVHHILSLPIFYLAGFLVFVYVSIADRNSSRDQWHVNKSCPHHTSPKALIILYIFPHYPSILYSDTFPPVGKLK